MNRNPDAEHYKGPLYDLQSAEGLPVCAKTGKVSIAAAQLSMLLEGIDWRMLARTRTPLTTG